jgi:hypothetical protein
MERDGVDLSFQNGKRRKVADNNSIRSDEAKDALNTVESMRLAGLRRAALPRWYGIGIALLVAVGFALYAQKDPGSIPGLIIALGAVLFIAASREKTGALGKAAPQTASGIWALVAVIVFMLALFFGGIFIRRAYDLAWVPVLTGLIAGTTIFLLSESERRHYVAKGDSGSP